MYKIIGADQREYGPVSVDRIREWILAGRVNALTRIQLEGGEWRTVSDFPEFQEVLQAQAAVATPPPRIASTEADRLANAIVSRDYLVDIGEWFSRGWQLLLEDFWLLTGATAVILVLTLGIVSVPVIGTVAILLLGFVLWGSLGWLFLKKIRGQRADMGDAFAGFTIGFVPLMLGGLVIQALTAVGLVLCVVPGIYLIVIWWLFVPLLIMDKQLDFWPAMELSRKVVNAHWWQMAALTLAVTAVALSGLLIFGVGILLTFPLGVAASVYAYEAIFGKMDLQSLPLPPVTHPPPTAPAQTPPVTSIPPITPAAPPTIRPDSASIPNASVPPTESPGAAAPGA